MAVLDTIYRIFMFILPFAICFAAYFWVGKKAWKTTNKTSRVIALVVIGSGVVYTVIRMVSKAATLFSNDNFEYIIIIVMVVVLAIASIVMAIGEPAH